MSACKATIGEVRKVARTKDVETSEGRIMKPKTVYVSAAGTSVRIVRYSDSLVKGQSYYLNMNVQWSGWEVRNVDSDNRGLYDGPLVAVYMSSQISWTNSRTNIFKREALRTLWHPSPHIARTSSWRVHSGRGDRHPDSSTAARGTLQVHQ